MSGNVVGALKHRLLDAAIIAKHGGIIEEIEYDNFTSGITELINMLHQGDISGFLVDSQIYFVFNSIINYYEKIVKQLQLSAIVRTEKLYKGEKLSFGVLMKNKSYFEYFKNYFADNLLVLESCYHFRMNAEFPQMPADDYIFDTPRGGLFFKFLYCTIGTIGLIGICGAIYELRRHHNLRNMRSQVADVEEIEKY